MDWNRISRKTTRHVGRAAFGCAVLIYPAKWIGIAPEPLSGWWVPVLFVVSLVCWLVHERMLAKLAAKVESAG